MKTLHELLLWRYIPLFLVMMAVILMPAFSAEVNVSEKALNISDLKNVTVDLIAQNMTFNTSMITVPAGANVTDQLR